MKIPRQTSGSVTATSADRTPADGRPADRTPYERDYPLEREQVAEDVQQVLHAAQLVLHGLAQKGPISVERLMQSTGLSKIRVLELLEHPSFKSAFQERLHVHTMLGLAKASSRMADDVDNEDPGVRQRAASTLAQIHKSVEPREAVHDEESALKAMAAVLDGMKRAKTHVIQTEQGATCKPPETTSS